MELSFSIRDLALFQVALFAIFSPMACIGPYVTLTGTMSRRIQKKMAFRIALYSAIFLVVTAWAGEALLKAMGISVDALAAGGGLILILTSLPMIMEGRSPRKRVKTDDNPDEGWETLVISPLVFPLTMGAGSISMVVTHARMVVSIADRLAMSVVIIIHGIIIFATYFFSSPLSARMHGSSGAVVTRIGGIILISLAFIIFTNGLKGLLPGLAG